MKVLITGTSSGIGRAIAVKFLEEGHTVYGLDVAEGTIKAETGAAANAEAYHHFISDVTRPETFPDVMPEIIVNNAGVQNSGRDIEVNLKGMINISEHYAFGNPKLRSIVNIGSASGITGAEFPEYAASKGGVQAYTKNLAIRLAPQATCNSINPGGVLTDLNKCVIEDEKLWNQIMELTPLKRWAEPEEIAEWVYFLAVKNRFMTGQNLLIDGGEAGNMHFVWPDEKN